MLLALADANAARESLGVVLSAVHVHHGLRGAEADADEAFVAALCTKLGIALTVTRVDTAARQTAEGEGLEAAARELRYGVFRRLLEAGQADLVATGHTLDDQAETVMMKLLRGAWTEGLGGISPVLEETRGRGRIVRPCLDVRRAEVEEYLRGKGQGWREDSSNADVRLTRNRIRHELMPILRDFNPAIDESLARMAGTARDEEAYWQGEMARLLPTLLLPGKPVRGGGRAVGTGVGEQATALQLDRLKPLPAGVRRRLVRAAAASVGCRLSSLETAKVLALGGLERLPGVLGRIGSRLELGGGLRVERSARELRLSRSGS